MAIEISHLGIWVSLSACVRPNKLKAERVSLPGSLQLSGKVSFSKGDPRADGLCTQQLKPAPCRCLMYIPMYLVDDWKSSPSNYTHIQTLSSF